MGEYTKSQEQSLSKDKASMRKSSNKNNSYIIVKNNVRKKKHEVFKEPTVYLPSEYKIDDNLTGKGVEICIIDSGCPKHKDINIQGDKTSFCEESKGVYDKTGHSTIVSGIISARNQKTVTGFAPFSILYFAKVVDDNGQCSFNSIVASLLWAIVKEVDIILLALGTKFNYEVLHDSIKKAKDSGIIVIASAGNNVLKEEVDYPAKYEEVISVASLVRSKKDSKIIKEKVDFTTLNKGFITTYLDDSYIKATGSSISAACVTSLASLLVEKHREKTKKADMPKIIKEELSRIL